MVDAVEPLMWVTGELGPEAQVGGLGEVSRALPALLTRAGLDVRVAVPGHRALPRGALVREIDVLDHRFSVEQVEHAGVPTYVLRCDPLFNLAEIYGDVVHDAFRFGVFSRAAVLLAETLGVRILHAHDWQTGLVPVFARHFALRARSVFTVHNAAYQGVVPSQLVPDLGLPWSVATEHGLGFGWQQINLLKGGTLAADLVTTVSKTHAWEITQPEHGFGLHEVFAACHSRLVGISNGIDAESWDPAKDAALAARVPDPAWKAKNKQALREKLQWPASERPLLCSIGRLVEQKGIDLLVASAYELADFDLLVIGKGDPRLERELGALQRARPERVRSVLAYDDALSRLALGAADFFVMPSRFEPAGLAQRQAQRYGAIPIVRRTGGLVDTVVDMGEHGGNGICFADASLPSLSHALERALDVWSRPSAFAALRAAAMKTPVSWGDRIPSYLELYRRLS